MEFAFLMLNMYVGKVFYRILNIVHLNFEDNSKFKVQHLPEGSLSMFKVLIHKSVREFGHSGPTSYPRGVEFAQTERGASWESRTVWATQGAPEPRQTEKRWQETSPQPLPPAGHWFQTNPSTQTTPQSAEAKVFYTKWPSISCIWAQPCVCCPSSLNYYETPNTTFC